MIKIPAKIADNTPTRSRVSAKSAEKARRKALIRRSRGPVTANYVREMWFEMARMYFDHATNSADFLCDDTLGFSRDARRRTLRTLSREKASMRKQLGKIHEARVHFQTEGWSYLWAPIGGDVPFQKGVRNV